MAYVTDLSYEEILNRLKMQTDINFQFEKESADNKDKVYILSVRIMSFFSKKADYSAVSASSNTITGGQ